MVYHWFEVVGLAANTMMSSTRTEISGAYYGIRTARYPLRVSIGVYFSRKSFPGLGTKRSGGGTCCTGRLKEAAVVWANLGAIGTRKYLLQTRSIIALPMRLLRLSSCRSSTSRPLMLLR